MQQDVRQLVGMNVRRVRLATDLSQAALASLLGIDRAYVSGLEQGARNPTVVTLWHFSVALKVPIDELLRPISGPDFP